MLAWSRSYLSDCLLVPLLFILFACLSLLGWLLDWLLIWLSVFDCLIVYLVDWLTCLFVPLLAWLVALLFICLSFLLAPFFFVCPLRLLVYFFSGLLGPGPAAPPLADAGGAQAAPAGSLVCFLVYLFGLLVA